MHIKALVIKPLGLFLPLGSKSSTEAELLWKSGAAHHSPQPGAAQWVSGSSRNIWPGLGGRDWGRWGAGHWERA